MRDALLGLRSHDYDAVVARDGLAIAQRIAATLPGRFVHLGGKEFAAYRLVGEEDSIDLWDREETPLESDLARRDFTVNALALDLGTGGLIDLFGGLRDLESRTLRAVGAGSFTGDPLRVLRLPRLALKLPGFSADSGTLALARLAAPAIVEVAPERVRDELALILTHAEAGRGLALLHSLDLYPGLWLGTPGTGGGEQRDLALPGALAELEALPACATALLEALGEGEGGEPQEGGSSWRCDLRLVRLAATFRHLGPTGEALGALERFGGSGYLSPRETLAVHTLLEEGRLPEERVERRRFYHRLGPLWPTAALSVAAGEVAAQGLEAVRRRLADLGRHAALEAAGAMTPPKLLSGHEIQTMLGLAPGPRVGEILKAVLAAQVDGRITTREEALALARAGGF